MLPIKIGQKAGSYQPALETAYGCYATWLAQHPRMTFFPEYTDHGVQHLSRVAQLSDFLVCNGNYGRPDSWDAMSSEDALVLAGAILYHDMAMFISQASFAKIIDKSSSRIIDAGLDRPWPELWGAYLEESRHWEERTIRRLFGKLPWSHHQSTQNLSDALRCASQLTDCQILFIGEFLRRHHHRLAHEIVRFGWPGDDGPRLILNGSAMLSPELRDLVGLVARSHGMHLRGTFNYLSHHHSNNIRESCGVHAVYLMSLLRIADVLHVHAERAEGGRAFIQRLASPYSQREWESHQAIFDVRLDTDEDPEAICIDVHPRAVRSASALFRLREWHSVLQTELDQSWSVLGEVYGRYERLSRLWLSLRRVKSNLYNREFESQLTIVPCRAAFDTAQGEYLKLLVQPLYGDRPGVGVRELLQNALDAVRERRALFPAKQNEFAPIDPDFGHADVILAHCSRGENTPTPEKGGPPLDWLHWFEVSDRGIGMTAEIVRDYFLKAGATYRRSSDWQRSFVDENGHSKVLRTGRFGVGALAAFLLGDRLQVITRHHSSSSAIEFTASLEDELINIFHSTREIGTTVRVKLVAPISENHHFSWDWYRLADPVVVRVQNAEDIDQSEDPEDDGPERLPSEGSELPLKWRRISSPPFTDIHWTYEEYGATLTHNGMEIGRLDRDRAVKWHPLATNDKERYGNGKVSTEESLCLAVPSVSVFDPDGALPLTLTRDRLASETYPFSEPLLESVMRDMLAYALVCGPTRRLNGGSHAYYRGLRYPGYTHAKSGIEAAQWASLAQGFTLSQTSMLRWAGVDRCIVLVSRRNGRALPTFPIAGGMAIVAVRSDIDPEYPESFWPLSERFPKMWIPSGRENPFPNESGWRTCRALIRDNVKEFLEARSAKFKVQKNPADLLDESFHSGSADNTASRETADANLIKPLLNGKFFIVESENDARNGSSDFAETCEAWFRQRRHQIRDAGIVCEWFLNPATELSENAMVALWRQVIGQPLIPYAMTERRKQLAHAFEVLTPEVAAWEALKRNEERDKAVRLAERPRGSYPYFLNQQEIKDYLRNHNVKRSVRVRKASDWWGSTTGKVVFQVYVPYSREELSAVNPATPQTGNPFKGVEHDHNLLPDFKLIQRILDGSNAAHPAVRGPLRED